MENLELEDSFSKKENSMKNVIVRKARISDVDRIFKIYSENIEYLDEESKNWLKSIIKKKSRRARIYVALRRKKLVGFIIFYKKRKEAYIDAFAVDSRYRGLGIGRKLLNCIEQTLELEGVKRIYLSVKNRNNNALGLYLKNGYKVINIVFILEAGLDNLNGKLGELEGLKLKVDSVKKHNEINSKIKLLDTSIWSNLTWDIDDSIYKISKEEATYITIYSGKRLIGVARAHIDKNKVVIERLALSYYKATDSLITIASAIKTKITLKPKMKIRIPVDSSKASLLKALIAFGFKIINSEYVLCKDFSSIEEN
ncbi:GNAT family N-acetyltransferase [Fervidicoccus fontis]|uniref:GNAT family N-acetyltransferase n=2 Tax=Fervidicoccus TaxID=685950 RepID=A0A843A9Y4_9CREN|nr:GNAT family N-acetyltransferase [Fervidicoccus fontis]MBE9390884.1 GNAT family N-acetyltransferase [Fervidicoccus fontis]